MEAVNTSALRYLFESQTKRGDKTPDNLLNEKLAELDNVDLPSGIDAESVAGLLKRYGNEAVKLIGKWKDDPDFDGHFPENLENFARFAITYAVKKFTEIHGSTGIVFAGFGDHDIFPKMFHYKDCGFAGVRFTFKNDKREEIDYETPA